MIVSSIGEILVDIIPERPGSYRDGIRLEAHLGGAPFNYATALARLEATAYGMGAVGNDPFGYMLINVLRENNVKTDCVKIKNARTSLAFVILNEDGERSFFFYREPWAKTADTLYSSEDICQNILSSSELLYVSGMALSAGLLREAVIKAIKIAKESDVRVIFDFNIRPDVWTSFKELREVYEEVLEFSDIISISIDEIIQFYNIQDPIEALKSLRKRYKEKDILIKLGSRGCLVGVKDKNVLVDSYRVQAVDTTGAGDAWIAAFSYYYYLLGESVEESAIMANALGAITVTKRGAISAYVSKHDLENFVSSRDRPVTKNIII